MKKYEKPKIDGKKIKMNQFMSSRFFDSANVFIVPPVLAQSGCGSLVAGDSCGDCGAACGACSSY